MRRNILLIGLCIATISMGVTGCSSAKQQNSQNNAANEKVEMDKETIDFDLDVNQIQTTKLYEEQFKAKLDRIGKADFESVLKDAQKISKKAEITQPTSQTAGRIKIPGENGYYVQYVFYPNEKGDEIVTSLSYSNELSQVTVSNNLHQDNLKYYTAMITRDPRKMEVNSEEDLRKFMFAVSKPYEEAYKAKVANNEKFDVTIDVEPIYDEKGAVSFRINTNLPDKAKLLLTLQGGTYAAQTEVEVENKTVETDTFSDKGTGLAGGTYTLTVYMSSPVSQAKEVQDIVGINGEFMTGKYVEKVPNSDSNYVYAEIPIEIKP